MAGSKFAYVRKFELPDTLLPGTFMVFRLDGHSFHRFSEKHNFVKPNDSRALELMDHAARDVMDEYPDLVLGFGESDEYSLVDPSILRLAVENSHVVPAPAFPGAVRTTGQQNIICRDRSFLLRRSTDLYNRRQAKIVSTLTSLFTSSYVYHWQKYFPNDPLQYPPSFDGRIVLYPEEKQIRDYFAWRQADTHINNLYNTVFWALVQQGGETTTQAHATLKGTFSKEKHEILFTRFQLNYNQIDERYRKGSVLVREEVGGPDMTTEETTCDVASNSPDTITPTTLVPCENQKKKPKRATKPKTKVIVLHCDIIKDDFWSARPAILNE